MVDYGRLKPVELWEIVLLFLPKKMIHTHTFIYIYISICVYIYIYISYTETGNRRTPRLGVWSRDAGPVCFPGFTGWPDKALRTCKRSMKSSLVCSVRLLVRSFVRFLHPGRLTWTLQITHLERKMIFPTSMIMFHVNLPGCIYLCGMVPFFGGSSHFFSCPFHGL